jgi:hypothetical protein
MALTPSQQQVPGGPGVSALPRAGTGGLPSSDSRMSREGVATMALAMVAAAALAAEAARRRRCRMMQQ